MIFTPIFMQFFIFFTEIRYLYIQTPKNNGEKKITHPGERAPEAASVEIIQARKEISSVIGQIIIARRKKRSNPGYIYMFIYIFIYIREEGKRERKRRKKRGGEGERR